MRENVRKPDCYEYASVYRMRKKIFCGSVPDQGFGGSGGDGEGIFFENFVEIFTFVSIFSTHECAL